MSRRSRFSVHAAGALAPRIAGALLVASIIGGASMAHAEPPLVFTNGRIVTQEADRPRAEAMVIENDRIVWIGGREEIPPEYLQRGRPRDLGGAVVLPGLADAHLHVEGLGIALEELNLVGTTSYEEVIRAVREQAATTPKGEWILGRGWDQNDWPVPSMPNHEKLSEAVPDHPVYLRRVDGHAALVNRRAMAVAKISFETPDPDGGRVLKDASGHPTGVLVDNATNLVQEHIPEVSPEIRMRRIERGLAECARVGLTSIHVPGADREALRIYRRLREEGRLPVRLYVMVEGSDEETLREELDRGPTIDPEDWLTIRTVKLYADGALGSRGAALLEPYADDSTTSGLLTLRTEKLSGLMRRVHAAGFQLAVHAIGDRANRVVLTSLEKLLAARPRPDHRHRIEHVQILDMSDLPRLAELGVVASMQFTHATSDMPWAEERLGPSRLAGAYAWKALLRSGDVVAQGSDAPVERPEPMLGLYAGITRQDANGLPEGGWLPEQRLTPEEALAAATIGAAKAAFTEDRLGRLSPGFYADFVVTDTDPLRDPPEKLLRGEILETWVGGRRRWPAE